MSDRLPTPVSRSAFLKAFGASFAVYLIPLVGPHAYWLLGEHLYMRLRPTAPDRVVSWVVMEWCVAVALQAVAGALWYWFFARPRWTRILLIAACVPALSILANWTYLFALPSLILIEQDTASDLGNWKTVCAVPDMWLAQIRSAPDTSLERTGQAWVRASATNGYAVLTMPDCRTRSVKMPDAAASFDVRFVSPAGVYLLGSWDNKTAQTRWWVGDGSLRPLSRPPADRNSGTPVLSTDGNWAAWVEAIPDGTRLRHVVIRSLDDGREHLVDIPAQRSSQWILLDADMERQELTFFEYEYASRRRALIVLGLDGERRGQPLVAEGVEPQDTTFLRVGSGWVAWDATREGEGEPYRVAWALAGGRGTRQTLRGRSITAIAVDPSGTYLAVSTTTALNIGHISDAVSVLRASDGKDVWHRSLPTYTRTPVTFLGDKLFAYTDWDGARATVRVLQIPD